VVKICIVIVTLWHCVVWCVVTSGSEEPTVFIFGVQYLKMEAVYSSKTLVPAYQMTCCHNPSDQNMHHSDILTSVKWESFVVRYSACNTAHIKNLFVHSDAEITVIGSRGSTQKATVVGVDDFGFLRVRGQDGLPFSVHPDGNSFDMLRGLVAPSVK
jgi:hypothetical protein